MKIVLSNTFYPPDIAGGAEVIASGLARYLQARGHELSVLTVNRDRSTVRDHVEGIEVTRLGVRNFYWHHPRIRRHPLLRLMWHYRDAYNRSMESSIGRFLDEKQPDLLFSHNLPGLSAALWKAADQRRIPVVQVLHDYYSLCPRSTLFHRGIRCVTACGTCGYLRRNHRDYSAHVDTVVGVSRAVLQQHLDRGVFAATAEQCVIHNAKQIDQHRPPREPQSKAPVRFGFIGTLTETKGLSVLLEEYLQVRDSLKRETELLVAGTGVESYEKELKERFAHPQIKFLGRVKPEEFFSQIDCSVVPSIWEEPFPTVVLESLGAGVPVLGARRGGIPEMVQHELNGLLFDPIAAGELGSAFAALAENETQLISLQNQARPSIAHLLDTDAWIDQYEALFARVVERANLKTNAAS